MSDVPVRVTRLGDGPELPGMLPATLLGEAVDGHPPRRSVRDWIVDVVAFFVALFGGLLLFFAQASVAGEEERGLLLFADVVAGLVCVGMLWWRRRWPVHLAVVAAVLGTFSAFSAVAGAFLLFTVAVHRRVSVVAGVAALGFACGVVFVRVRPDPSIPFWVQALLNLPIVAAVVAWGMFVRARRQLVFSLRDRARRAESEQQLRVEQARYLERARIAREMHDVLAHRISLVSLHAGALEYRAEDAPAEDVAKSAAVIRSSAHEALQDLREILGVLRAEGVNGEPGEAERPQPTLADVARLVEESRQAGVRVSLECAVEDLSVVPGSIGRTAYRVVQEGLTNARKHAPGAEVVVGLSGGAGPGLAVEVRNRWPVGVPVTPGIPGARQGLTGLAERAAIAGGRLEHGRTPAGDFRLAAWLPWPA